MKEYFDTNRELWNQKVEVHKTSEMYELEAFKQGKTSLNKIELDALAAIIAGKRLLHLQCHFGLDTLSWARMGAQATGIDLSPRSIELAKSLNEELGLNATFVESNVYDLPQNLAGKFDIIFTSYGTVTWLPDLDRWASVIDHFLDDGGIFYIADFHPTIYMFDHPTQELRYNYFNAGVPYEEETQGTYTDFNAKIQHKEYFWTHSLADVIDPLVQRKFQLLEFKEFPYSPYNCFENMVELPDGNYVYRGPDISLPHIFSLKMQK